MAGDHRRPACLFSAFLFFFIFQTFFSSSLQHNSTRQHPERLVDEKMLLATLANITSSVVLLAMTAAPIPNWGMVARHELGGDGRMQCDGTIGSGEFYPSTILCLLFSPADVPVSVQSTARCPLVPAIQDQTDTSDVVKRKSTTLRSCGTRR